VSASGDKTVKLWDVASMKCVTTFIMGDTVEDQQVGCLWSGNHIVSVSLSGFINYLDPSQPEGPVKVVKGHNRPITALALSPDKKSIYSADSEGRVITWDSETGTNNRIAGKGHGAQINGLVSSGTNQLHTIGFDDTVRTVDLGGGEFSGPAVSLSAQPRALEQVQDLTFVCTLKSVVLMKGGNTQQEFSVEFEPSCCSYSSQLGHLAVGESGGNLVRVYNTQSGGLDLVTEITLSGSPMDVRFSPDQKYLVTADSNRKVTLFTAGGGYEKANNKEWGFHTAKVNCVAWAPNSLYVASGGLDTTLILWSVEAPDKHCVLRNAHDQSQITCLAWLDNSSLVSAGQDGNIKVWNISWPN